MSRRFIERYALSLALPFILGGCATLIPPAEKAISSEARQAPARPYAEKVDLGGRLSVRYQHNGKDEAAHGSFVWAQDPLSTNITLLSPLGQTIAIIDITPNGAILSQAGQPPRRAADVDALVAEALGWPLPVAGLRDWLQGFAMDANGNRFIATPRATDIATRDGWRIRYAGWQDDSQPSAQSRPRRIDLERYTAQAGDVSIRIVLDKWQPHP
jgi:outer membrane lipoprotein LolB